MSRICYATFLTLIVVVTGCSLSHPGPLDGVALTYDGVEFTSDDYGEVYSSAEIRSDVKLTNVKLVLPDGHELDPLMVTPDLLRAHELEVDVSQNDGRGNFYLYVGDGEYESLQGQFENNRVKYLVLTSHIPYGNSTICIKIRNEAITIPVRGDDLKNLFGLPDAMRQFTVGRART